MLRVGAVRWLEARFHPQTRSDPDCVVVARVRCRERSASIEPLDPDAATVSSRLDRVALLAKLHFLVEASLPRPFERLRELRSAYWSFTELP